MDMKENSARGKHIIYLEKHGEKLWRTKRMGKGRQREISAPRRAYIISAYIVSGICASYLEK